MPTAPVPHFQLYGEGTSFADPGFVHVETIESRSSLTGWEIRPHQHDTLDQLLIVREGGVAVTIEGQRQRLSGPLAIHVPAGAIHGFAFDEGVDGAVISFSVDLLAILGTGATPLAMLPGRPVVQPLPLFQAQQVWPLLDALRLECSGHAPGRIVAAGWLVGLLLIHLTRAVQDMATPHEDQGGRAQRFRALVDRHFREHRPLAFYAEALGTTERSLARLVHARFGCAPMQYIHRRLLLEARRLLVYGKQPVSRIAEELGFSDPSYFTRFYSRMSGDKPSALRAGEAGS